MIIQKNKAYDPSVNRAICHFQWEIQMDIDSANKVMEGIWRLKDDVNEWCIDTFGPMFLDGTLGTWAASTLPIGQSEKRQIVFYFKKKDDALLFKLTWN